jgi:hypothetical protein
VDYKESYFGTLIDELHTHIKDSLLCGCSIDRLPESISYDSMGYPTNLEIAPLSTLT